ncbi:LOW QUALITY PROTEIN: olfactory receptor 1L3-like [Anolis sagrei]|uniref:LOW QUALITY PROTEIN: olfactory receptor 1L3-like n=1 Tax=Anolis sagrei TaxID=38937 RepID=UPI0035226B97
MKHIHGSSNPRNHPFAKYKRPPTLEPPAFPAVWEPLLYTLLISWLSFRTSWEIPFFFCDIYPFLDISCSDTRLIKILALTEGMVDILGPFALIVISYECIFHAVMKVPMAGGQHKAFSTCGSHLVVIVLFYSTISCLYFQPTFAYSTQKGTFISLLYAVLTPTLNPFIYSLRNHDIKAFMARLLVKSRAVLRKGNSRAVRMMERGEEVVLEKMAEEEEVTTLLMTALKLWVLFIRRKGWIPLFSFFSKWAKTFFFI